MNFHACMVLYYCCFCSCCCYCYFTLAGTNKNIFRFWEMNQWVENAHIMDVIDDHLIVINFEVMHDLNKHLTHWPKNHLNDIKQWFLKSDALTDQYLIPMKLKDYIRDKNGNNDGTQLFCVLKYKNMLVGIIGWYWGEHKYLYSTTIDADNGPPTRAICANTIAKGLFAQCIDLSDVNLESSCGLQYIPIIDKNIIKKQNIQQQQQQEQKQQQQEEKQQQHEQKQQQPEPVYYDNQQTHKIGFVKQELHSVFSADFKEFYNVLGLAGAASNYPCPWCLIHKNDNMEHVTVSNRSADPRHYGFQIEQVASADRVDNNIYPFGCKACPIYKYYPNTFGCPWVHQIGGVCGNYIYYIFIRFMELNEQQQQQYEEYTACQNEMHICNNEIIVINNLIRQSENSNIEIRDNSVSPDIFDSQQQQQQQEQEVFDEYDVNTLRNDLLLLQQRLKVLQTDYERLHQAIQNYDRLQLWNDYKKKAGFAELGYRPQEVTGPNALSWVNNYQPLLDMLKPVDTELYRICELLMPCLKFILNVGAHKNLVPLSDECINAHKFAILQQESLGWKLTKLCRKENDEITRIPMGVKNHTLYHNHSRMEHTRMSTAYWDDQKTENNMKKCKHYVRFLRNGLNKPKVRSMVRKMNAEQGLRYDSTNKRGFK